MKKLLLSAVLSTGMLFSVATPGVAGQPYNNHHTQTYYYYHHRTHTKRNVAIGLEAVHWSGVSQAAPAERLWAECSAAARGTRTAGGSITTIAKSRGKA